MDEMEVAEMIEERSDYYVEDEMAMALGASADAIRAALRAAARRRAADDHSLYHHAAGAGDGTLLAPPGLDRASSSSFRMRCAP
jgi:hypothetical protein